MEKIIEYIGIINCILGVLYFVIRFFYFGTRKSFESEIKKITKYEYFLLIKKADVNSENERRVRVVVNIMLRVFYLIFILALVCLFIFTVINIGFS